MKYMLLIARVVIAASALTFGAEPVAAQTSNVEQELIKLDKEWGEAGGKADTAVLARIIADDFIGSSPEGIADKAKSIADAKAEAAKVTSSTYSSDDYVVRLFGNDMAVMTHRATVKGQEKGKAVLDQHRSLHVWMRRQGRWQVVASQEVPITSPSQR